MCTVLVTIPWVTPPFLKSPPSKPYPTPPLDSHTYHPLAEFSVQFMATIPWAGPLSLTEFYSIGNYDSIQCAMLIYSNHPHILGRVEIQISTFWYIKVYGKTCRAYADTQSTVDKTLCTDRFLSIYPLIHGQTCHAWMVDTKKLYCGTKLPFLTWTLSCYFCGCLGSFY